MNRLNTEANVRVQEMLDDLIARNQATGLQMTVYFEGKLVVDAWAGVMNHETGEPVKRDTLFPIFSTCKGISATIIHRLVARGLLDYDTPICHYWPEFAAHGKDRITLRHALTHTAGVPNMPVGITIEEICDTAAASRRIADLVPVSAPGECEGYHAMTYGWLVSEVASRAVGRDFRRILKEEICDPLHLQDGYIGIPDEVEPRIALLEDLNPLQAESEPSPISPTFVPLHQAMNDPRGRRSVIAGSSGIMSAHFIARHFAALLPGGVDGVELLSPQQVAVALEPFKLPDGNYSSRAGGYSFDPEKPGRFLKSGGYGGSAGMGDISRRLATGFVKNRLNTENEYPALIAEVERLLGI